MKNITSSIFVPVIVSIVTCTVIFLGYTKYSEFKKNSDWRNKQSVEQNFQKGLNNQKLANQITIQKVSKAGDVLTIEGSVPQNHSVDWVFSNSGCRDNPWYKKILTNSKVSIENNSFVFKYQVSSPTSDDYLRGQNVISLYTSHYDKYDNMPDEQILGDGTKICHLCNPMNKTREVWIDTPKLFIREWSKSVCNSGVTEMVPSINTDTAVTFDFKKMEWCQMDNYSGGEKTCSRIN